MASPGIQGSTPEGIEPSYDLEAAILAALLRDKVTQSISNKKDLSLDLGLHRHEELWLACLDYFVSRLPSTIREVMQKSGLPRHLLPTVIPLQNKTGVLPSEIILLVLEPSEDSSAIVKCRRCTARPEGDFRPRYRVLSYDWGNPAKARRISLNGTILRVTKNLESGLRHLRRQDKPSCVWVDPLCVDHRDGQTRGSGTEALRYIYARAEEVVIWLGDESETSEKAFRFLGFLTSERINVQCSLIQHELRCPDMLPQSGLGLGAVMKLMERRWWHRAGLLQQLMHGCKVTVHCGNGSEDWNSFIRLFEILQQKEFLVRNRTFRYLAKVFPAVYLLPQEVLENLPQALKQEQCLITTDDFFLYIQRLLRGGKLEVNWVLILSKVALHYGAILTGLAEKICNRDLDRIRLALYQDPQLRQRGGGCSPEGHAGFSVADSLGSSLTKPHRKQKAVESAFLTTESPGQHKSEFQCWLRLLRELSACHTGTVASAENVTVGSQINYESLKPTSKQIRVLLLKSIADTDGLPDYKISCELISLDLDLLAALGIHKCPFISISKEWAPSTSQAPILLDGEEKAINLGLYDDLQKLRQPTDDSLLWLDPICTGHGNPQEKALEANFKTWVDRHSGYVWSTEDDLEVESCAYTPPLCSSCKTLPWNQILVDGVEEGPCAPVFSPRLASLRESVASGCHLCSLVWHSLLFGSSSETSPFQDSISTVPLSEHCSCIDAHSCSVYVIQENSEALKVFAHCKGDEKGATCHAASLPLSTSAFKANTQGHGGLRHSTSRKRSLFRFASIGFGRLTQTWIDDCCQHHADCGPAADYELPTRVICVGNDLEDPYLWITNGATGKWVALSYCWGSAETVKTTEHTLEDHKKRIPLEKLPRTIRDAILTTRSLGVKYLWVDALCIIQGSKDDWTRESARMSDVYRNSLVTIAASSAVDVQGSLFLGRNRLANLPCPISFQSSGVRMTRWIHGAQGISWREKITQSPLQQRGWTLQEAQLSVRILHYSDSELLWQCRGGVRRELAASDIVTADDAMVARRMFDGFSVVPMNVFSRWYRLIEDFTTRRLTNETDKLPAISGMASEVARFIRARSRRRLATQEEIEMNGGAGIRAGMGNDFSERSAWFLLHMAELAKGEPTSGLEDLPLDMVPDGLLSRYMGSDINPWPGKEVLHNALCDECFEPIRGMRHKCQVCLDFDYCSNCITKADALHPLHSFTQISRVDSDRDASALGPTVQYDGSTEGPEIGREASLGSSSPLRWEKGDPPGLSAELYVYAEEDRFPPIVEWPDVVTDDEYIAGLWRADLIQGLTWHVDHGAHRKPGKDAEVYRAPSWSWASINGPVRYKPNVVTYLRAEQGSNADGAEVQGCRVTRTESNRFGTVSGGELTLVAPIIEMPYFYDGAATARGEGASRQPSRKQNVEGDFVGTESLHLDHEPPYLPLNAICAKLDESNCLVLELIGKGKDRALYRRIGIWGCDNHASICFNTMTGWESKVVTVI